MKTKKKFIVLIFLAMFIFVRPTPTYAVANAVWGVLDIVGDTYAEFLNQILDAVVEGIAAAAKMAAVNQTTSTINSLLYDGDSSARNIGNYYNFMMEKPAEEAVTYAESFLTDLTRGTASSDYVSGGGGSTTSILTSVGTAVIKSKQGGTPTTDYEEKCPNLSEGYFADGVECFDAFLKNSANMPVGVILAVDEAYNTKYQTEKFIKEQMANTTGVLPSVDEDGNLKLPSSVVEEIQLQQIKLPLASLANSDGNIFSSMIQGVAVGIIMEIVTRGIAETTQSGS